MATRPIKWRKTISGAVYVHSFLGNDNLGDGTQAKPYKTLTKAGVISAKKRAICIGYFAEDMNGQGYYGANGSTIEADYYGAAVFDGQFKYTTWGVTMTDMIIINVTALAGGGLVGVGRANLANSVGSAGAVNGVASAPNLIHNCCLHFGCIGGNTAVEKIVYSKIIPNSAAYKIWIGNGNYNPTLRQSTVYDIDVTNRMKCQYGTPRIHTTIFGKVAMIANDSQEFTECLFTADCKWYVFANNTATSTYTEVVLSGTTSEERYQSLVDGVTALGGTVSVKFFSCIFSSKTSDEIFNDPEKLDFTLKPNSEAVRDTATGSGCFYLGALPPALSIPIMDDSTGVAGTWDERSIEGCIEIVNGKICLNEANIENGGKIYSKIVQINPQQMQLNGIYSVPTQPMNRKLIHLTGLNTFFDQNSANYVQPGTDIPVGWYKVHGTITYLTKTYYDNEVIYVTATGTQFTDAASGSYLVPVIESNTNDVLYCRCRRASTVKIKQGAGLQSGATYLNNSGGDITYRNRTVVDGESFVAMNSTDDFSATDPDTEIAVMFDDTRVQSAEWIPAQQFGEYFVSKTNGAIAHDDYNVPISSGNCLAFQPVSNGGYADRLRKSIIDMPYVQFALFVEYYNE